MSIRPLPALKRSTASASASDLRQQIAAVGQDHLAKGSDPYRPRTSGPVKDGATEGPLQRGDLLAHRRLGVAKPGRRSPERSFLGDGSHGPQVAQLDVRPRAVA